MEKRFFDENRNAFAEQMEDNAVAVFFSGKPPRKNGEIMYEHALDRNFYYLSGLDAEGLSMIIHKRNGKADTAVYYNFLRSKQEIWFGKEEIPAFDNLKDSREFVSDLEALFNHETYAEVLYIPTHVVGLCEVDTQYQNLAQSVRKKYPAIQIKNCIHMLTEQRLVKRQEEIDKIRESIDITDKALRYTAQNAKYCNYEYELRAHLHYQIALHNCRPSFETVCAAGKNTVYVCSMSRSGKLQHGDLALIDIGVENNYYTSDITRALPISGKFTEKQKTIYQIVLDAQQYLCELLKPNCCEADLDKALTAFFIKELKKIKLIKLDEDIHRYQLHGLGHSLGLLDHDLESRDQIIPSGSLWTLEPALFVAEWGFGIRIEDDFWVRDHENINLSANIPKAINDIENMFL